MAVVAVDDGLHEQILPDQAAVPFHDEIQLLHESRIVPEDMEHIVFAAARTVYVPEGLPDEAFGLAEVLFLFQTDGVVVWIHGFFLPI